MEERKERAVKQFTKQELARALIELQAFMKEQEDAGGALNKLIDGHFVFTFGSSFIDSYIRLLEQAASDEDEWIAWFIWENDFGGKKLRASIHPNGEDSAALFDGPVGTVDDLWAILEAAKKGR